MESLKRQVTSIGEYSVTSPKSPKITIATWTIRFAKWLGKPLDELQKGSYKIKPLVEINGEPNFGELAILRLLQKDGWDGVWVDTYHDKFWKGLPDRTKPCSLPEKSQEIYDKIVTKHGRYGGFFDVFAWREQELLFAEYKGEGDKLKPNQISWIEAAVSSGISPDSLLLIEFFKRS
jgi:VRR-NUC domain